MFSDGKTGQSCTRQLLDVALWVWWLSVGMNVIGYLSGSGESKTEAAPSHYALVIDAGSTGNRIHVYTYTDDYPIPSFDFDNWNYKKFKPGLSSFEQTPNEAGGALEQLVDFAKDFVPKKLWKSTPIQLRATAGMRKVRAKNPSAAKQIMKSVQKYLEYNSPFKFEAEWASIIEGTSEGRYGWITANYLNGFFKKFHDDRSATSTGVLEMGGESVQLTFVPNKQQMYSVPSEMLDEFSFAGEKYPLFVHSWMGYGFEAAQDRQDMNYYERTNPCYLKGTVHTYQQAGGEEKHDGSGSWPECYLQTKDLINEGACQEKSGVTCALDGVTVPSMLGQNFYLIENFYYTAEFFADQEVVNAANYRKAIERAGTRFCALDHQTVVSVYPDQDEYHFSKECFGTAYIAAMLDIGFHIDPSDYDRFQVVREIHNIGIDWALGAVMDGIEHTRSTSGRSEGRSEKKISATASFIGYFFHTEWLLICTALYAAFWAVHIYRFGRPGLPPYLQRMLAKPRRGSPEGGIELQGFLHATSSADKDSNDGDPSRTL